MTQTEHIDPTGWGLLLVAAVSLPGALDNLLFETDFWTHSEALGHTSIAAVIGVMILVTAILAYKANSNFGMVVLGMVGTGVLCVGGGTALFGASTMGAAGCIVFGIIFAFFIFWSYYIKTAKLLTILLVTTALIFILSGVFMLDGCNIVGVKYAIGVCYLLNFIFTFWLGMGLCCDKIKTF